MNFLTQMNCWTCILLLFLCTAGFLLFSAFCSLQFISFAVFAVVVNFDVTDRALQRLQSSNRRKTQPKDGKEGSVATSARDKVVRYDEE